MTIPGLPYGFRVVGSCHNERRLIISDAAFVAHCADDLRAENDNEIYLSAFCFGQDFRNHLETTGSVRGFGGDVWAAWLWVDIDGPDLPAAREQALRIYSAAMNFCGMPVDAGLIFFSGSKGFHVGIPSSLWGPLPADDLHRCYRRLAETLAADSDVVIDAAVYDRVRAFRAPNSKHPKTGLHKRRFEFDELVEISADAIPDVCRYPSGFNLPAPPAACPEAVALWQEIVKDVRQQRQEQTQRAGELRTRLNRSTLDFIREGAGVGDRHRAIFAAAANLAEFGCPEALAHALLTEAGRDSGLSPSEVRRQIDCGLKHITTSGNGGGA